jgi:hypothetical protein
MGGDKANRLILAPSSGSQFSQVPFSKGTGSAGAFLSFNWHERIHGAAFEEAKLKASILGEATG